MWLAVVNGGWSRFSACSVACSGGTRSRTCSRPAPANGGKDCVGAAWALCNMQDCAGTTELAFILCLVVQMFLTRPTDVGVTDGITRDSTLDGGWSSFGACSVACNGGTQSRTCSEPSPANGGKDCAGNVTKACNTQACGGRDCERLCAVILVLSVGLHIESSDN